jgi:GT2 family glycosyltransferase
VDIKVAAIIPNYNMLERCDALVEHLLKHEQIKGVNLDIIVVDNASDLTRPSQYSALKLKKNIQTTGAWNAGIELAKGADFYWTMITSAEFIGVPVLKGLLKCMKLYSHCVGVHPALTQDSTTSWNHLKEMGIKGWRKVWMIDNIAALWRADWFDSVGGFDPRFTFGWGPDLELAHLARGADKTLYVSEPAGVRKITDIGYAMNRMGMSAEDRRTFARSNMREVMTAKYGEDWYRLMYAD